jgi:hypothetical protein
MSHSLLPVGSIVRHGYHHISWGSAFPYERHGERGVVVGLTPWNLYRVEWDNGLVLNHEPQFIIQAD